jgi:AbiV family abortive infection protein
MRDRQYNQKLTPEDAAKGMKAALENAKSLLQDAILLHDNGRYERATALAILAIEEAGKPAIVRMILLEDDAKEVKKGWQDYRKHTSKNTNWIVPELIKNGARHIEEMRQTVDDGSSHRQTLDKLKQLAFYSDVFSNCKWSIPKEVIDKELSETILNFAKLMAGKEKAGMTSEAELKLWVKYLKPVWKSDMIEMKQALVNCYQEAEQAGLLEKGRAKEIVNFVL